MPGHRGRRLRERLEGLGELRERWGTREFSDELLREGCPPLYESEEHRRRFANEQRVGASPAVAYAINRAHMETDLRDVLPAVRVPALVLYLAHGQEQALDVAGRIPSARAVRIPGEGWFGIDIRPEVVDELERFVAGEGAQQVPESVLATLMFTDIVSSTERAAELGDRAWRDLLAQHNALVRRELARFRGEERDTAGDGFFATFDGPARAIRAAQAIVAGVRALGLEIRAGVHIGECELHEGKLAGVALSVGARIAARREAARCSSRPPSATSSPAPDYSSSPEASASSRARPARGRSTRRFPNDPMRTGLRRAAGRCVSHGSDLLCRGLVAGILVRMAGNLWR